MARVQISRTVQSQAGDTISGATVQVNIRNGAAAIVYSAETGNATLPSSQVTDATGRIQGWVDEGSYDLVVTYGGTTQTQRFEAVRGDSSALTNTGNIIITSDSDASGSGDIIFKNGVTEAARFTVGKLGIGLTSGLSAPLHVRTPGTGSIALFEPNGGGAQFYHFNELGLGAVGDNVNLPYIAVENNSAQDIRLRMSVSNAAGNLAKISADSVSGNATPSFAVDAPSGDIYIRPGGGASQVTTTPKRIFMWAQSGLKVLRGDGAGLVFEARPDTAAIGFYGTAAAAKQTVTGSRSANAALASLLTALATIGLITDTSTV